MSGKDDRVVQHSDYWSGDVADGSTKFSDAVIYLQRGTVKVTVVSEQGKEAVVAIFGRGEFFGEGFLAGRRVRISTVTTMMDSVVARIEERLFVA